MSLPQIAVEGNSPRPPCLCSVNRSDARKATCWPSGFFFLTHGTPVTKIERMGYSVALSLSAAMMLLTQFGFSTRKLSSYDEQGLTDHRRDYFASRLKLTQDFSRGIAAWHCVASKAGSSGRICSHCGSAAAKSGGACKARCLPDIHDSSRITPAVQARL